mmetsp:Transcript_90686/g.256908  ORF Transcript_90686/g.256908 Transcript_90686/m.256908 type:complete len:356 (+) Transcript_90686:142-1209(+)
MLALPPALYFIEDACKSVFTYTSAGDGTFRFTRLAPCQQPKYVFVFFRRSHDEEKGWVLQDRTPGQHMEIIGTPCTTEDTRSPPVGPWKVRGHSFTLTYAMPDPPPLSDAPLSLEVPFASMRFAEAGFVARLEVTMKEAPITDDALEVALDRLRSILRNLAQRPQMVLFFSADARSSAVPAVRHIRRYLDFIKENGVEFVLVGRGCAIILRPTSFLGQTLIGIYKMVQRLLPSPWEERVVSSPGAAEAFLGKLAVQYEEPPLQVTSAPPALRSAADAEERPASQCGKPGGGQACAPLVEVEEWAPEEKAAGLEEEGEATSPRREASSGARDSAEAEQYAASFWCGCSRSRPLGYC